MIMLLLRNTLKAIKDHPERAADIIDSFSDNQFKSKDEIFNLLDNNSLIGSDTYVVIMGCWYGSILIEYLAPRVKHITAIDMDEDSLRIGKNSLFPHYNNVDWIGVDLFEDKNRKKYREANLFINASCEHMPNMKEWPHFPKGAFFAFTSNNMFDIEGHVNCVRSLEQFEDQLPTHMLIDEAEVEDERGTRFILVGQFC